MKLFLFKIYYICFCLSIFCHEKFKYFRIRAYSEHFKKTLMKRNDCRILIGKNFVTCPKVEIEVDSGSTLIIGNNVRLREECRIRITNGGTLSIGDNVYLAKKSHISCWHHIDIKKNTIMAARVHLLDHQHKFDLKSPVDHVNCDQIEKITLGEGVWLGTNVVVLNGSSIGDFSVIGANSVVTKGIPSGCVAGGVPAKVIKTSTTNGI